MLLRDDGTPLQEGDRLVQKDLAATLSAIGTIPVEGMVLILGVDQLMASARATTNLIGNGTATIVIARWEGALDKPTLDFELRREPAA